MAKEKKDHILSIVKAGVSAVPCIGGPIANLIGDYIPTATQKSIETSMKMLSEELENLKDKIDVETVNKDEFAELFKSCYLTIVRAQKEAKLRGAVSLITNILLKDDDEQKLSYTELDHFVRCLENLSIGAIQVLGHCVDLTGISGNKIPKKVNRRFDFDSVRKRMLGKPVDLIMGLLEELNSFHLVHLTGAPSVRTPDYANYPIEIPPMGVRFSRYILKQGVKDKS